MTRGHSLLAIAVATLLMMTPALWNGFPLLYFDSVDYIRVPFDWDLPVYRTMPYVMMGLAAKLAGTLWVIPLLQSLAVAWVLHETLAALTRIPPALGLFALALVLTPLTGLPWFASQVMADVFTGLVVLGIAALALGRDRLGPWRSLVLVLLTVIGLSFHTSHLALAAGLVLCLLAARLLPGRWVPVRPGVALPLLTLIAGFVLVAGIHWATLGRPFITQPSTILMLGRMVQDGLAQRYLNEVCPTGEVQLVLCEFRDSPRLDRSANGFLWSPSPFTIELGGWSSPRAEAEAATIVHGALRRYPWGQVQAALGHTLDQLTMFRTGDGLAEMRHHANAAIRAHYPKAKDAFKTARQHDDPDEPGGFAQFPGGIDFALINRLHLPVLVAAMLVLPLLMRYWWRRGEGRLAGLAGLVLLALLGNAFICGALSNPNHRYQSRIAWLPVLVVAIAVLRRLEPSETGPAGPI